MTVVVPLAARLLWTATSKASSVCNRVASIAGLVTSGGEGAHDTFLNGTVTNSPVSVERSNVKNKPAPVPAKPKPAKKQKNRIFESPVVEAPFVEASVEVRSEPTVTEDGIRERAYLIWKDLGEPHGQETHHWVRAERELARGI
jgi:hypothetical protein